MSVENLDLLWKEMIMSHSAGVSLTTHLPEGNVATKVQPLASSSDNSSSLTIL